MLLISIGTHSTLLVFKLAAVSHCVVDRRYLQVYSYWKIKLLYKIFAVDFDYCFAFHVDNFLLLCCIRMCSCNA